MSFKIFSVASGRVLDVFGGSKEDRAPIIQFEEHDGANQRWTLSNGGLGDTTPGLRIRSEASGKVLDVKGGSLDDLTPIIQFRDLAGLNQRWSLEPVANGVFKIVSLASGKVLDVEGGSLANGAPIIQFRNHGGPNQLWRLIEGGGGFGPVAITSQSTGLVFDVRGGSLEDGADIIQFQRHNGPNQQWLFEPLGSNFFKITSAASGKVLDVLGGSLTDGAPIIQFPFHGGPNQQWMLTLVGNPNVDRGFFFKIMSRSSGKVLGLGPSQGGARVIQQFSESGSQGQHWSLLPISIIH